MKQQIQSRNKKLAVPSSTGVHVGASVVFWATDSLHTGFSYAYITMIRFTLGKVVTKTV